MSTKDINSELENPVNDCSLHDLLTQTLRNGAQRLIHAAVTAEFDQFIQEYQETLEDGRNRLVRNGHLPDREVTSGIGPVTVSVPRVKDRKKVSSNDEKIRFSSNIVPKYLRRTGDINELLPLLYLKGISTGEFQEALLPIVGDKAKNISASVISDLKRKWSNEYNRWLKKDLSNKQYVYWWADGIHLSARMSHEKQCVLVIMGVDRHGNKELIGIQPGYRESKDSWKGLLSDLKHRGLTQSPVVAVGDGALGFWAALNEEHPSTSHQRCWFHKLGNILDKLPKSQQSAANEKLKEIWGSSTRKEAMKAVEVFCDHYESKYPKAVACLIKDLDELLTFFDYPAEHWTHLRTTNPIESTFATVRHRTKKSKNCHSEKTVLIMVYKLIMSAEKRWYRIRGSQYLNLVMKGMKFEDGVLDQEDQPTDNKSETVTV